MHIYSACPRPVRMMHRGMRCEMQGPYGVGMHFVASKHIVFTAGFGFQPLLSSFLTVYQCGR